MDSGSGTIVDGGADGSMNRAPGGEPISYKEKLRSLSFMGTKTTSKTTVDHTDVSVVHTTVKDESQDVHVVMNDCIRPHWKAPKEPTNG